MSWPLASLLGTITVALLFIGLERVRPYDKGQVLLRDGFTVDFFWYTIVQSLALGWVINQLILAIDGSTQISRLHLVTAWPIPVQLAFFFVTHDLYIYWMHRAMHHNKYLWRLHEAHHATVAVDWLSGSRSHPLEILLNQTIEYAPIVLLGAHADVAPMKALLDSAWGMYIHCNVDIRSGFLQKFINGPEMHRWHHSGEVTEGGFNYGTKLAIWDWIFGTAYLPETKPPCYGLSGGVRFPADYFKQILFAFRSFKGA
jgi:sterol desaturase/sphingolipid hydroxylase (fatty acid hydroxylase superfamily)